MISKLVFLSAFLQTALVLAQFGNWDAGESQDNDEIHMNAVQLITSKGYPCEVHTVVTQDGYILELHRIPHGRNARNSAGDRPVVLLQHGLMGASTSWVLNPPDQSLPFVLADAGVDVWLGNNRGNPYSKRHVTLHPNQLAFWDFSFDETAKYDLPAQIDYILSYTRNVQLYYVGHSQGAALGLAKFSEDLAFAKKVKHFIALAPIARVGHITSALRRVVPVIGQLKAFSNVVGNGAIDVNGIVFKVLTSLVCVGLGNDTCIQATSLLMGDIHGRSIDMTKLDLYNAQYPTSTSMKTIEQLVQGIKSNCFKHFDYGAEENYRRYGQVFPPTYEPSNINIPVALFSGGSDAVANPTDINWLRTQMNLTHYMDIPWYNHMSHLLAYDAKDVLYPTVIPIITGKPWASGMN